MFLSIASRRFWSSAKSKPPVPALPATVPPVLRPLRRLACCAGRLLRLVAMGESKAHRPLMRSDPSGFGGTLGPMLARRCGSAGDGASRLCADSRGLLVVMTVLRRRPALPSGLPSAPLPRGLFSPTLPAGAEGLRAAASVHCCSCCCTDRGLLGVRANGDSASGLLFRQEASSCGLLELS